MTVRDRLITHVRDERGVTIVVTMLALVALSALGLVVVSSSSSNTRSAVASDRATGAQALAEAGIAEALSLLHAPGRNVLSADLLPSAGAPRVTEHGRGSVTWHARLDETASPKRWVITATGQVANPTGPLSEPLRRTMTAVVPLSILYDTALGSEAWNYVYAAGTGDPSGCDVTLDNAVTMTSPLYVAGNLCLDNTGTITHGPLVVHGQLSLLKSHSQVGTPAAPLDRVEVGAGCKHWKNPLHDPCSAADNVYAEEILSVPRSVVRPDVYWEWAYLHASPGPYSRCMTSSGPVPVFDNDQGSPAAPDPVRRNRSVVGSFHLTPNVSYVCRTAGGELSWDALARRLTVRGVIFLDGNAYVDNVGVFEYDGRAAMYLSGSLLVKNASMCAVLDAGGDDCDWAGWQPSTDDMLVVVTNGTGGQTEVDGDATAEIKSAAYQGALYGTVNVSVGTTATFQGPIITEESITGQTVTYVGFPGPTMVPIGTPGQGEPYAVLGRPSVYG